MSTIDTVRTIVGSQAGLNVPAAELTEDQDLFEAGMTSHKSVSVMMTLEDEFDLEFPAELLTKSTFTSLRSITDAVDSLA